MERAWLQGLTGCGTVVAVVDDGKIQHCSKLQKYTLISIALAGVEYTHDELRTNYVSTIEEPLHKLLLKLPPYIRSLLFSMISYKETMILSPKSLERERAETTMAPMWPD